MESESGEIQRGGKLAGPSIGHLAAAEEAGRVFADLAGDDGPAGRRAESRVVPTPSRAGARFAHRAAPAAISPSRGDGDACGGGSHDRRDRRNRARTSCATCCRQAPRRPPPTAAPSRPPVRPPIALPAAVPAPPPRAPPMIAPVRSRRFDVTAPPAPPPMAPPITGVLPPSAPPTAAPATLPSAPPSALFMSPAMAGSAVAPVKAATTRAGRFSSTFPYSSLFAIWLLKVRSVRRSESIDVVSGIVPNRGPIHFNELAAKNSTGPPSLPWTFW